MIKLYPAMAAGNIKSNRKTFLPYILSCIMTTAVFYIVLSLAENEDVANMWGGNIIQSYMEFGQYIVGFFAVIFLFYINSFLVKRRKREFGLYNILGMEKRHIARVIGFETLYTFLASMALGIGAGILLDRLMYLIIMRIFDAAIPLGFYVSAGAMGKCCAFFGIIFCLILVNSVWQIRKAKPVELLQSGRAGEKEPKARWALALLGLACLVSGYFIAVTTENPIAAFTLFFGAVALVIIGTYLLFTTGSIALLKLLRKNKGYYYKTKHFISISGMMYRMKRNAVGLANICILSTMVMVIVSATLSMYLGLEDSFAKRYPKEITVTAMDGDPRFDEIVNAMEKSLAEEGLRPEDALTYRELSVSMVFDEASGAFVADPEAYSGGSVFSAYEDLGTLIFVPLEDYNDCMGTEETLAEDEVLVYSTGRELEGDTLRALGQSFTVKKRLDDFMENDSPLTLIMSGYYIVVRDMAVVEELYGAQAEVFGEYASFVEVNYMTDVAWADPRTEGGTSEAQGTGLAFSEKGADVQSEGGAAGNALPEEKIVAAYENARAELGSAESTARYACRSVERATYGLDFTGPFFIGIFLGLLFLMATVMIMYYKQITEGYEDKERFAILQNVGMSHEDVRRSIGSQILTVFFLPLVTAGVHVAFAFPFIYRIMTLLNLFNMKLFACCTAGCFLVFGLFYTAVYLLTAKLYYGIVKK